MRAEYAAFRARVREHPILANKTFEMIRVNQDGSPVRANYVALLPALGELDDQRYTKAQSADATRMIRWDVRTVAVDADGLLLLVEALEQQLVGHVLTVPGRTLDPIRVTPAVEEGVVRNDRTTELVYVDQTYETTSRRAAAPEEES